MDCCFGLRFIMLVIVNVSCFILAFGFSSVVVLVILVYVFDV